MPQPTRTDIILTPPHGRKTSADARFLPDGKPKPVVIFVHGFKGFKDWGCWSLLADYFAQAGFVFIKLNLSHNGTTLQSDDLVDMEAFGNNNFSLEMTDLDTLLNFLFSDECAFKTEMDLNKIGMIGHSRGGGLVLLKAAEEPRIKAVATWASVSSMNPGYGEDILQKWKTEGVLYNLNTRTNMQMPLKYQLYEDFQANQERFDVKLAASKLTQPLLIIHGDNDAVVPEERAYELQQARPDAEILIVTGANHSFGGSHPYSSDALPEDLAKTAEKTAAFFRKNFHHA